MTNNRWKGESKEENEKKNWKSRQKKKQIVTLEIPGNLVPFFET